VELAPALARATNRDGLVIASGVLDYQADDVVDALATVGIQTIERKQEDDWIALVAKRCEVSNGKSDD